MQEIFAVGEKFITILDANSDSAFLMYAKPVGFENLKW